MAINKGYKITQNYQSCGNFIAIVGIIKVKNYYSSVFTFVDPPNWFERMVGRTWKSKIDKANKQIEKQAQKKVAQIERGITMIEGE